MTWQFEIPGLEKLLERIDKLSLIQKEHEKDEVLTAVEAAKLLKLSPNHVRKLTREGLLPGLKGGGAYRYSKQALLHVVATGENPIKKSKKGI